MFILHADGIGWDEILVAVVGLGVMWLAIRRPGRKPSPDEDEVSTQEGDSSEPGLPGPAETSSAPVGLPPDHG